MVASIQTLVVVALLAAVQAQAAVYTVMVGYDNVKTGLNINKNFPATLRVHVGDQVVFKQNANDLHTVTFYDQDTVPDVFYMGVYVNTTVAFPTPLPAGYSGGFASSGILDRVAGPPFAPQWKVKFPVIGSFKYVCAVHGISQNGTIIVVPKNVAIAPPTIVSKRIKALFKTFTKKAPIIYKNLGRDVLPSVKNADNTTTHYVKVGGFQPPYFEYLAFFPKIVNVRPKDSITYYGSFFHTVTFLNGAPVPPAIITVDDVAQINPAWFTPTATNLTRSGFVNSGLLVDPLTQFKVTVGTDVPGRIQYICQPHVTSKMIGFVNVLPPPTKKPVRG